MSRYDRYEPRRATTKDSWITIDWGKRAPPSALHGILDQIAGKIIRDPKLVEQGKREWHKAAAIRRERRKRAARGEKVSSSKSGSGSGSGSGGHSRSQSTRLSSTRRKTNANTGFFAGLFGASKNKKRQSGVKRALTRPGQQRTTSSGRRPTTTRRESSKRR